MITKNFLFKNFQGKKNNKSLRKYFKQLIVSKNEIIKSLTSNYYYSYTKQNLAKFQECKDIRIFGMGGSSLGANAIYDFLKYKIKKNFYFLSNLQKRKFSTKKNYLNLIISKSGNTLETIVNSNIYISKKDQNIVITENKISYLRDMGIKLKSEIIDHNNFIGGRYSVLSEVGMLPAELMGLNEKKFKQFNSLLKNKYFFNAIISNVTNIVELINKKKSNAVILNYDESLDNFLKWYQQLLAESIGKKAKGIFPIISTMPKDNHSLMQLYLDGQKNNFYTFFSSADKISPKINKETISRSKNFLINKNIQDILDSKILATQKVFKIKKIPFRSFFLKTRKEETLGELFTFFIVETILIAKALKINPYDQPAVELIKKETNKILVNS
ncbi:glucose-6-phosphate isomerase [Candidatus Pelagibacter sp.]|uniref:glucose-6-phosphate isomerase n=1 Tax=Candidatus Pelagibacter sp. TaxID=2024849 RepID=UPI003F8595DC